MDADKSKDREKLEKDSSKSKEQLVDKRKDKDDVIEQTGNSKSNDSNLDAHALLAKLGLKSITIVPKDSPSPTKKIKLMQEPKSNRMNSPLPSEMTITPRPNVKSPVGTTSKTNMNDKTMKCNKESGKLDKTEATRAKSRASGKVTKSRAVNISKVMDKKSHVKAVCEIIPGIVRKTEIAQDSEENSDFLRTYNMMKIQNPQILASRAAKLNMVKQTLLNIENEKNSKSSGKDKAEKCCDDCGTPLSSGRDFIMHRDKCEVRQKKLEKILSGLPKSLQNTPQKDESPRCATPTVPVRIVTNLSDKFEVNATGSSPEKHAKQSPCKQSPSKHIERTISVDEDSQDDEDEIPNTSSQKTPSKTKSPFRSLYNLYDGLNKEHIDIILKASRNERTLRSRSQEQDEKPDIGSEQFSISDKIESSPQSEIIITTRITGNVIERNTLIRPIQNDSNDTPSNEPTTVDEAQAKSRNLYETLKNSYQNGLVSKEPEPCDQNETPPTQPQRELISDCPQGLPRSANIRKLLKRNVLNPIRMKGPILSDSKKYLRMDRKSFSLEKSKMQSFKKKDKLGALLNHSIIKKKKFLKECQKDLKTSWQIEETEKKNDEERNARAMRANNRSIRKTVDIIDDDVTESRDVVSEETTQTRRVQEVTIDDEEEDSEEEEEEDEQVVPTANLFIPYNFATPAKEVADKSKTDTANETPSQLYDSELNPNTSKVESDPTESTEFSSLKVISETLEKKSPETTTSISQQPHTPSTVERRVSLPASKQTNTPATPKSREQIMLKQEILEELRKLESRKWCEVCNKPFANNSTLQLHYSSHAHKKRVEKSLFGRDLVIEKEKKKRGRKKGSTVKKEIVERTPETSEDEDMDESLFCEDEEDGDVEHVEEEEKVESVEKNAKKRRMSASSDYSKEDKPLAGRRSRRSSTLDKEQKLVDSTVAESEEIQNENTNVQNKETQRSKTKGKHCSTCNVSFPSEVQLNRHFNSKMHKTASVIVADGKPKVCSVCKVSFTTNTQLHRHYATQTHKTAAAKMVNELEGRGVIKTALFP